MADSLYESRSVATIPHGTVARFRDNRCRCAECWEAVARRWWQYQGERAVSQRYERRRRAWNASLTAV